MKKTLKDGTLNLRGARVRFNSGATGVVVTHIRGNRWMVESDKGERDVMDYPGDFSIVTTTTRRARRYF